MRHQRAHIKALAIINWRGIQFQILDMDRRLTALEGENGAGKTTCMTAAYLLLMPNISLLGTSNVEDSGDGKKRTGLHGKLGESGACYSVFEIINPRGERCLAGAMLHPLPSQGVEIKKLFVAEGLPAHVPLESILLLRKEGREVIPVDASAIVEQAVLYGAKANTYTSVADYGTRLYELGILPIKLGDVKKQIQFNKILQTGFQGNFSTALQKRIKEYLLPENDIGGHLAQMQEHMRQCRSSRVLVSRLQDKIETVHGLHQQALTMIDAAAAAVRLNAAERKEQVMLATERLSEGEQREAGLEKALAELKTQEDAAKVALSNAVEALQAAERNARLAEQANEVAKKMTDQQNSLVVAVEARAVAKQELDQANGLLENERRTCTKLREEYRDVCDRLADASRHWQKVSMEAGLYEGAKNALEDAQRSLPDQDVSQANVKALFATCEEKVRDLSAEASQQRCELEGAQQNRERFTAALVLTEKLAGQAVIPESGQEAAHHLLIAHDRELQEIEAGQQLPAELANAKRLAKKQVALCGVLEKIADRTGTIDSSELLRAKHDQFQSESDIARQNLETAKDEKNTLGILVIDYSNRRKDLLKKCETFRTACEKRSIAVRLFSRDLNTLADLQALIVELDIQKNNLSGQISLLTHEKQDLEAEITAQSGLGDDGENEILQTIGGRRLSSQFEDLDRADAGELQARLGPLVDAVIVKDVDAAVAKLETLEDPPQEMWLVESGKFKIENLRSKPSEKFVTVRSDIATRITRFPRFPKLGHDSRKAYVGHLRNLLHEVLENIKGAKEQRQNLSANINSLYELEKYLPAIEVGDPQIQIEGIDTELAGLDAQLAKYDAVISAQREILAWSRDISASLQQLLPDSRLLDEEDYSKKATSLEQRIAAISCLKSRNAERAPLIAKLALESKSLRYLPLSEEVIAEMDRRQKTLQTELKYWSTARQALLTLTGSLDHFKFEESFRQRIKLEDATQKLKDLVGEAKERLDRSEENEKTLHVRSQMCQVKFHECDNKVQSFEQQITRCEEDLARIGVPGNAEYLAEALRGEKSAVVNRDAAQTAYNRKNKAKDDTADSLKDAQKIVEERKSSHKKLEEEWRPINTINFAVIDYIHASPALAKLNALLDELKTQFTDALGASKCAGEAWAGLAVHLKTIEPEPGHPLRQLLGESAPWFRPTSPAAEVSESWGQYLNVWAQALVYITQIIPADVIMTSNPSVAVEEMRLKHRALEEALRDAENSFRASAKNVASTINRKIHDETRKISRHNTRLESVSFGSLAGISIKIERRKDLKRLLEIMSDDDEWTLFSNTAIGDDSSGKEMGIGELMSKVYRATTGGRAEGEELLDYRSYINMRVLIRRKTKTEYEVPELSTGEAMGTGAAILMVVLQAWEENSLIRDKDLQKNLRFLFMDEATRLDPSSIKELLEFCNYMDVQLLVAGPSFKAKETGSGVTYRLARQFFDDGERVIMRARKGFGTITIESAYPEGAHH